MAKEGHVMEVDMAYLEIFETRGEKRLLREPAQREGSPKEAVVGWAQALSDADHAPFTVKLKNKYRGHELYVVRVGDRKFEVIVH